MPAIPDSPKIAATDLMSGGGRSCPEETRVRHKRSRASANVSEVVTRERADCTFKRGRSGLRRFERIPNLYAARDVSSRSPTEPTTLREPHLLDVSAGRGWKPERPQAT